MHIAYGVTGVGYGHAIRSKTVIEHLRKKHKVTVFTYGMGLKVFPDATLLEGFELCYDENKIRPFKTFFANLIKLPRRIKNNFEVLTKFNPDIIITDYEPMTHWFGKLKGKKVIGIDNINAITRIKTPELKNFKAKIMARIVSFFITPLCDEYLITTFFKKAIKKKTRIFLPILREEILKLKPKNGNHIVVYMTSSHYDKELIKIFSKFKENFIVYGFNKSEKINNVIFKKFSEKEFMKNLESSKAVICYGGFSLITESLYLKKPLFVLPIKDHYEQLLNADFVERNKFGMTTLNLSSKKLNLFLKKLPLFRKNLKNYSGCGNDLLFSYLDQTL
ncbi:hypothetical protein KY334_02975 [Candidatus Woesearchaeota archaeon]|nr:hypothetical protein [Candidatus Woesearchaeota archaeon]